VTASEWNSLRPGDPVVVHDSADCCSARPRPGVVEVVWVRRPTNEIGILVATTTGSRLVWPMREQIHERTFDGAAACPGCSARGHKTTIDPRLN
jgi:hypothetical protein